MAPFTVKHYPKEGLIELSGSGVQFGTVRGDRFSPYEQIIGEEASMSLERLWDEVGDRPEIPFRVRRFLDALDSNGVRLMYDRIRPLGAPFSATHSLRGSAWVFATRAACGDTVGAIHKVGEIHGDTLSIDGLIAVQDRMILDYLWRETEQDALKANP